MACERISSLSMVKSEGSSSNALLFVLVEVTVSVIYTDLWAVQIDGGRHVAEEIARKHGFVFENEIMPGFYQFRHSRVGKRSIRHSNHLQSDLSHEPQVHWLQQQVAKRRTKRDLYFSDPEWPKMWYLKSNLDGNMNVENAWLKGYTGKGVVVTILDDGIETDHPDLSRNYDPNASFDVISNDNDPTPRYDPANENRHGTRCAGEVAAVADNHICGLGVAFDAKIGGVRMLDGDVTDSVEASSLTFNRDHIDIYSASWGPDDDGMTVDGPNYLARTAFFDGVRKGRQGKGSIFIWASGNGGRDGDNCNCDGYTNSIYTLSISSATANGNVPWYSEACTATLASTYSSGSGAEKQVITTDLRKGCTETHTGTSASAPLAAGICALALEANPNLTWRDMQHIVVRTANPKGLRSYDWKRNGVGRRVSHSFGYGIMDAAHMVDLALNWTTVPDQHLCEVFAPSIQQNRPVPVGGKIRVQVTTDGCEDLRNHVNYLEHVVVKLTIMTRRRGEVQVYLVSPMGTRSTLLARRKNDNSRDGFNNWALMTTHCWGEPARGTWTLEVENGDESFRPIRLRNWSILLYGTKSDPQPANVRRREPAQSARPAKPGQATPAPAAKPEIAVPNRGSGLDHLSKLTREKESSAVKDGCCPEVTTMSARGRTVTATVDSTEKGELKKWSLLLQGNRYDKMRKHDTRPAASAGVRPPTPLLLITSTLLGLRALLTRS